jgi:ribosome-binding factor A
MGQERLLRINHALQRELAGFVERELTAQFGGCLVTLTGVRTSADLQHAQVGISVFPAGDQTAAGRVLRVLEKHRTEMQALIARRVKMRYTPVLRFILDESMEEASRVLGILDELGLADQPDGVTEQTDQPDGVTEQTDGVTEQDEDESGESDRE